MLEIPRIADKVKALHHYISSNLTDGDGGDGDDWHYHHNPTMSKFLETFSLEEYHRLLESIPEWGDEELYFLADTINDCTNPHIDGNYVYCKIFIQIEDPDQLEYLIQNLASSAWHIQGNYPSGFYDALLSKAQSVNRSLENRYDEVVQTIVDKSNTN